MCFEDYPHRISETDQKTKQKKNNSKRISGKKYRNENDSSQ